MDRFTRTRIPARYSRYRHNTLDLYTCSRKRTLFPSTVLAAVITVTAKYLSFVGGQGSCQHEAMAAPTCARAGSQLGTDHAPLDFSAYRAQRGIRLYFLLEHNYSLVTMSCILHIIWVNSCTRNKINFSKDNIARGLCTLVPFIITALYIH